MKKQDISLQEESTEDAYKDWPRRNVKKKTKKGTVRFYGHIKKNL